MGDTQANQRKKTRGEDYIAQGSILAVAVVITKIIGVVYRIPLTNILAATSRFTAIMSQLF